MHGKLACCHRERNANRGGIGTIIRLLVIALYLDFQLLMQLNNRQSIELAILQEILADNISLFCDKGQSE